MHLKNYEWINKDTPRHRICCAHAMDILLRLPEASVDLIYIDPPFDTGKKQTRRTYKMQQSDAATRKGFGGKTYASQVESEMSYDDNIEDYLDFLRTHIHVAARVLKPTGSLFVHMDCRQSHYVKILLDKEFGRDHFQNEIIWSYDFGGRSKKRWPSKHDTIFWYTMDPKSYTYNYDAIDRIPYLAPGLAGPEKAARGKVPTDVWWHTIVPTNGKEKTGYPTQKPLGILTRIITVHSNPDDIVLDFFAGSGTTGEAAARLSRRFILVDSNPEAVRVMRTRLGAHRPVMIVLGR